ncbi:HD domain-containing phosphohydrolase [Aliamphritea spongicola]
MAYILTIINGYARNLKFFISTENHVLERVSKGELDVEVPVTSNDEFGLMAMRTNNMISALESRTQELNITRDASILGLASLAETRDNETGGHILRTQNYVRVLAEALRDNSRYTDLLDDYTIELYYKSAPLHDVGKVGIPDRILLKPGKLTDEEFAIMKQHPQIGADALAVAENKLGTNCFLKYAREISLTHHEKWDGSGYPNGLRGTDIPVSGRLMALADVYDALISERVYKPAFSHEKAKQIILEGNGSHFDPDVIDAFLAAEQQFIEIADQFADKAMKKAS